MTTMSTDSQAMPSTELSISERKKAKAIMKSTTIRGNHSHHHKHPRRTTRPIISKKPKGARKAAENVAKVVAETEVQRKMLYSKLKLLEKLMGRQEASGKQDAAGETRSQMEAVQSDMRQLDMDLTAIRSADAEEMVDAHFAY